MSRRVLTLAAYLAFALVFFVCTMVIIKWAIVFVTWTTLDSGWAEGIGSIAALGVAIFVMSRQNTHALRLLMLGDLRTRHGRISSVGAVLRQAEYELKNVVDRIKGEGKFAAWREASGGMTPADIDLYLCTSAIDAFQGRPQFAAIMNVINQIPIHELGSVELVRAIFQARDALKSLEDHLKESFDTGVNHSTIGLMWNSTSFASCYLQVGVNTFEAASDALADELSRTG